MVAARRGDVESSGPYSTVKGQVTLPQASDSLLFVITTQHHAKVTKFFSFFLCSMVNMPKYLFVSLKVLFIIHIFAHYSKILPSELAVIISCLSFIQIVEVMSPSGKEVDLVRDSSQRFWAVMEQGGGGGNFTYALKFLTSSVAFPLPIVVDLYARRSNSEGVTVTLHTSNSAHSPLEPESPPLVVWARVTHAGRPVVGARVLLRVSRLSEGGAADTTVELLDDGNAGEAVWGKIMASF